MSGFREGLRKIFAKTQESTVETPTDFADADLVAALNNIYAKWAIIFPSYFAEALNSKGVKVADIKVKNIDSVKLVGYLNEIDFDEVSVDNLGAKRDVNEVATLIVMEVLVSAIEGFAGSNIIEDLDEAERARILEKIQSEVNKARVILGGTASKEIPQVFNEDMLKGMRKAKRADARRGSVLGAVKDTFKSVTKPVATKEEEAIYKQFLEKTGCEKLEKPKMLFGMAKVPFERTMVKLWSGNQSEIPGYYIERYLKHRYLDLGTKSIKELDANELKREFIKIMLGKEGVLDKINKESVRENNSNPLSDRRIDAIIKDSVGSGVSVSGPIGHKPSMQTEAGIMRSKVMGPEKTRVAGGVHTSSAAEAVKKVEPLQAPPRPRAYSGDNPPPPPPRGGVKPPPPPPKPLLPSGMPGVTTGASSGQPKPPPPPPRLTKPGQKG